jgi:CHAD domain-containing protein
MMLPIGNKAQVGVSPRRLRCVGKGGVSGAHGSRELVLDYLCTQIDELRAREPGVRIDSPDAVHRMRVATRRLRSSLATFGRLFSGAQAQHLRDELLWLGAVLGPVRDVAVMRDHLHHTAATLAVDADLAGALAGLDHELVQRHSRAHKKLIRALDSSRYSALLAGLTAFAGDPPWIAKAAKRPTLAALVGRACARVDRAATAARGVVDLGGPELHEVRKAAKRARYAAELVAPSAGAPARSLARRMEDLQEVLGRHQDSLMARELLRDLAGRMPERQAYALGLLTGLEGLSDESVLAQYGPALAAASGPVSDRLRGWTPR